MQTLLDLHGEVIVIKSGHWAKFVALRVPPDNARPHGISYALTFHAPDGKRVLGFDNAHPARQARAPATKTKQRQDHKHMGDRVIPYQWKGAEQLLVDFWNEVEKYIERNGL